jgi:hypothetical protein
MLVQRGDNDTGLGLLRAGLKDYPESQEIRSRLAEYDSKNIKQKRVVNGQKHAIAGFLGEYNDGFASFRSSGTAHRAHRGVSGGTSLPRRVQKNPKWQDRRMIPIASSCHVQGEYAMPWRGIA